MTVNWKHDLCIAQSPKTMHLIKVTVSGNTVCEGSGANAPVPAMGGREKNCAGLDQVVSAVAWPLTHWMAGWRDAARRH